MQRDVHSSENRHGEYGGELFLQTMVEREVIEMTNLAREARAASACGSGPQSIADSLGPFGLVWQLQRHRHRSEASFFKRAILIQRAQCTCDRVRDFLCRLVWHFLLLFPILSLLVAVNIDRATWSLSSGR